GQGADMRQHGVDAFAGAGDGAVDPLGRQQERALDPLRTAEPGQRAFQRGRIGEAGEVIEGRDDEHQEPPVRKVSTSTATTTKKTVALTQNHSAEPPSRSLPKSGSQRPAPKKPDSGWGTGGWNRGTS